LTHTVHHKVLRATALCVIARSCYRPSVCPLVQWCRA